MLNRKKSLHLPPQSWGKLEADVMVKQWRKRRNHRVGSIEMGHWAVQCWAKLQSKTIDQSRNAMHSDVNHGTNTLLFMIHVKFLRKMQQKCIIFSIWVKEDVKITTSVCIFSEIFGTLGIHIMYSSQILQCFWNSYYPFLPNFVEGKVCGMHVIYSIIHKNFWDILGH